MKPKFYTLMLLALLASCQSSDSESVDTETEAIQETVDSKTQSVEVVKPSLQTIRRLPTATLVLYLSMASIALESLPIPTLKQERNCFLITGIPKKKNPRTCIKKQSLWIG